MNKPFEPSEIDVPLDPPIDVPPRPSTYPENVPRPADPPLTQTQPTPAPTRSWWSRMWHNMGRDSILVLPGIFISVIAFPVLIALFSISIATFIIWIGALMLPLTLFAASGFANLSRARARQWGAPIAEVAHRVRGRGFRGWIGAMAEGRRWLDLLFETVFALPIRIFTFVVSVSWFFGALGGLTFVFWGRFLPDGNTDLIDFIVAATNDTSMTDLGFGAVATSQFIAGFVLLITFPFVLHTLARLEIAAITAGLAPGHEGSTSAVHSVSVNDHASSGTGSFMMRTGGMTRTGHMTRTAGEGWFWLISIFVGVALVSVGWPVMAAAYETSTVIAMLVVLAQSTALILAVRQPVAAIIVGLLSTAAGIILTADISGLVWPWTVTSILALIFLHLIIGLHPRDHQSGLPACRSSSSSTGGGSSARPCSQRSSRRRSSVDS